MFEEVQKVISENHALAGKTSNGSNHESYNLSVLRRNDGFERVLPEAA